MTLVLVLVLASSRACFWMEWKCHSKLTRMELSFHSSRNEHVNLVLYSFIIQTSVIFGNQRFSKLWKMWLQRNLQQEVKDNIICFTKSISNIDCISDISTLCRRHKLTVHPICLQRVPKWHHKHDSIYRYINVKFREAKIYYLQKRQIP